MKKFMFAFLLLPVYLAVYGSVFAQTPNPGGDCPVGTAEPNKIISGDWLLNCSDCFATATPPIQVPTIEVPEYFVSHLGNCTLEEIEDGCDIIPWPATGGMACQCFGVNPQATSTSIPVQDYYILPSNWSSTVSHDYVNQAGLVTKYFGQSYTDIGQCQGGMFLGYWNTIEFSVDWVAGDSVHSSSWGTLGQGDTSGIKGSCDLKSDFLTIPGVGTISNIDICQNLVNRGLNPSPFNFRKPTTDQKYVRGDYKSSFNDTLYQYPVCYGIPSEPIQLGYCNNYEYLDEGGIVQYPEIEVIQGSCLTLLPNFSYTIPAFGELWGATEIGWDGFQICPKWVTLQPIKVFDLELPLELMVIPFIMLLFGIIIRL